MPTFRRFAQHRAQASAWLLVLALLFSVGWGQVHRVLHAGVQTHAQAVQPAQPAADATVQTTVAAQQGLADEEGSSLCKLLDQLALGAGPAPALAPVWQALPPARRILGPVAPVHLVAAEYRIGARGPPPSA